jgi:hypothetical protein
MAGLQARPCIFDVCFGVVSMSDGSTDLKARRALRRSRTIAGLLMFGSVAGILVGAAAVNRLSPADFLARLRSPRVVLFLALFYLIYLPATLRIYYILLLNSKGVFTALERHYYQESKQKWEKYLFRFALLAGILVILLVIIPKLL